MDYEVVPITEGMKPLLTVEEASSVLHVHSNTLRRWSDSGIIKAYRIGVRGDRRFRQDDIVRFLAQIK